MIERTPSPEILTLDDLAPPKNHDAIIFTQRQPVIADHSGNQ